MLKNDFLRFGQTENIGHRGDLYRKVENTTDSFQSAFHAGADAVEFDVQMTQDGVPVVYHDDVLGGAGFSILNHKPQKAIGDTTYAELTHAYFSQNDVEAALTQRAGQPIQLKLPQNPFIPTLDEILPFIPQGKKLYIELKRPGLFSRHTDNLEEAVVNWVQKNTLAAVIISFNAFSLEKAGQLAPEIPRGLDIDGELSENRVNPRDMADLKSWLKLDYWLPSFERTTQKLVDECHALGLKIVPWIYHANLRQEKQQLRKLLQYGVDGLATNQPKYLARLLQKQSKP